MKEFVFNRDDRFLTVKIYDDEFVLVANSAKNQEIIRNATNVLNGNFSATEKVTEISKAIDELIGFKLSASAFGELETACYDEVISCYNFIVSAIVEHSQKVQEKYSPKRIEGNSEKN